MKKQYGFAIAILVILIGAGAIWHYAGSRKQAAVTVPAANQASPQAQSPLPDVQSPASQPQSSADQLNVPLPNGDQHKQAKMVQLSIKNMAFNPAVLAVGRDTAIEWINNDSVAHSIVADSDIFGSTSLLEPGQQYTFIATTRGTFTYHCGIHPNMKGTVTVK